MAPAPGWKAPLVSGAGLKADLTFGQAWLRGLIRRYQSQVGCVIFTLTTFFTIFGAIIYLVVCFQVDGGGVLSLNLPTDIPTTDY